MTRAYRTRFSQRSPLRRGEPSPAFPWWIAIPFLVVIGLILWLGVLLDSSGHFSTPGAGPIVYLVAVILVAALLAASDRRGDS